MKRCWPTYSAFENKSGKPTRVMISILLGLGSNASCHTYFQEMFKYAAVKNMLLSKCHNGLTVEKRWTILLMSLLVCRQNDKSSQKEETSVWFGWALDTVIVNEECGNRRWGCFSRFKKKLSVWNRTENTCVFTARGWGCVILSWHHCSYKIDVRSNWASEHRN